MEEGKKMIFNNKWLEEKGLEKASHVLGRCNKSHKTINASTTPGPSFAFHSFNYEIIANFFSCCPLPRLQEKQGPGPEKRRGYAAAKREIIAGGRRVAEAAAAPWQQPRFPLSISPADFSRRDGKQ